MRKILAYPLTVIYLLAFGLLLVIFHPIQWFCLKVFGYKAHKTSVVILNGGLTRCLLLLGTTVKFKNDFDIPEDKPLVIVANHQSMYDIPPIIWYFSKNHPKFISKKELGKGIPSVSFNLKHGGSVLIDRKDSRQSVPAILEFGSYINKNNFSAVIFPEGTRSRNGQPKPFQKTGLKLLFKKIPEGYVVPLTINNSWKNLEYGKFPMGIGHKVTLTTGKPLAIKDYDTETLITMVEEEVKSKIEA
ncbi:lysophospholipid acyltransferase family protein [Neptunitalea lumnitzerae]|uniref:1-acyl-sn-glycerol-3-phosphate acyltransferase n=1 Tax=Neptunitalea lumnitzerae TaxID=2965509 RepID=A0ABQ5MFT5_9FLAO|nr:lysophospholipid acyltransferase family protein [Neptunitalea sp. Y10]GLB48257.1 1-acyl-sn-glycerol-3-phosphate acyltransferase [Neptunitalea sp. Y10]